MLGSASSDVRHILSHTPGSLQRLRVNEDALEALILLQTVPRGNVSIVSVIANTSVDHMHT